MLAFISPAMGFNAQAPQGTTEPSCLSKTRQIVSWLQGLSLPQLQKLLGCSDALAQEAWLNYQAFPEDLGGCPAALLAFQGVAYKELDAASLDSDSLAFLQDRLMILNGLYGCLRPQDTISPYRLEMKTKAKVDGAKNLYDFWGDTLYQCLKATGQTCWVNLASKEYSICIEKYLQDETYVTCQFKQVRSGVVKTLSSPAKTARGAMVRWIAQNKIDNPQDLKGFCGLGYRLYDEKSSRDGRNLVLEFIQE